MRFIIYQTIKEDTLFMREMSSSRDLAFEHAESTFWNLISLSDLN